MSMTDKKFIIYAHINKTNNKIYIGQTCMKPENRWRNGKGYKENDYFCNAINKYGWDGFEHVILYENLSEDEANILEEELIRKYKSTDRKYGYNIMYGGNNHTLAESTKEKLSIAGKERMKNLTKEQLAEIGRKISIANSGEKNGFYGKKHTDKTKMLMREHHSHLFGENHPMYGYHHSVETRENWSKNRKNKNLYSDNPKARAVNQYDKDMNYIRTFSTIKEAAELCGIKYQGNISSCCSKKIKSCGGYIWRYADEQNEQELHSISFA